MLTSRLFAIKRIVNISSRFCFNNLSNMAKNFNPVAVVLSGCGVYDGSEVHEASAILVHLSRNGVDYQIYAPDIDQMHVVNHLTGEEQKQTRNVLQESARIARGKAKPLSTLNAADYSGVIFPGGFGAAKNLSNFAVKQADCVVQSDVERTLKEFHAAKKPIGLCCISPVLAARVINGCTVTLGMDKEDGGRWPYAGTAEAAVAMGAKHSNKDEIEIDEANNIVTTPAFMCDTKLHEIHDGIGKLVTAVVGRLK